MSERARCACESVRAINRNSLEVKQIFDSMVGRCMPNYGHGGPPGTRVVTNFVFYVNPQIPNIEYFEAYEVYKSREVSHLLSHQISFRMPSESCLGTDF